MEFKKFIFAITGLLFLMSVPATPARSYLTTNTPAQRAKNIHPVELNRESIVVAENESKAADNDSQSTNENKDQAPSSDTTAREKSGNDAETKPIKPFKPSEEIAAEQAVDYPVDIWHRIEHGADGMGQRAERIEQRAGGIGLECFGVLKVMLFAF